MEFLLYLALQSKQVVYDVMATKFDVKENVGFCKSPSYFGYVDHNPDVLVICTKNILDSGFDPHVYINETVLHEAVHAAQECNGGNPLGVDLKSMPLPPNKLSDIKKSLSISKKTDNSYYREHEAFYFEDKPERVQHYVKKFCF